MKEDSVVLVKTCLRLCEMENSSYRIDPHFLVDNSLRSPTDAIHKLNCRPPAGDHIFTKRKIAVLN